MSVKIETLTLEHMVNVVRTCLTLTVFLLTTSASFADGVLGTWLRDNGNAQVKFERCGDAVCGNIAWLKPGSDSKAKVGQRLFFDMRPAGANWSRQWVNLFRQNVD